MPRPDSISLEEYRRLVGLPTTEQVEQQEEKARKYRNKTVEYDSPLVGRMKYPSKRQAKRAKDLDTLWQAGDVRWWLPEIPIRLRAYTEARQRLMRVDFLICWADGRITWEDAKGIVTKDWSLKRDLVAEQYGINVETV